jgi:hypothetical protein
LLIQHPSVPVRRIVERKATLSLVQNSGEPIARMPPAGAAGHAHGALPDRFINWVLKPANWLS